MTLAADAALAAAAMTAAVSAVDEASFDRLVTALVTSRRIVCHGLGREGLMMRALAMRLYHAGLDAHVQGDMSCPPVTTGDLLLISAGPGSFATLNALADIAHAAGAGVACVTAQPQGTTARRADHLLVIPAQTMADDRGADDRGADDRGADDRGADDRGRAPSILPMGSLFEGAMFVTFELLVLRLIARLGTDPAALRARHTNLE